MIFRINNFLVTFFFWDLKNSRNTLNYSFKNIYGGVVFLWPQQRVILEMLSFEKNCIRAYRGFFFAGLNNRILYYRVRIDWSINDGLGFFYQYHRTCCIWIFFSRKLRYFLIFGNWRILWWFFFFFVFIKYSKSSIDLITFQYYVYS